MNKHLIVIGTAVLLLVVGLSGCNEQTSTENSISNWEKEQAEIERLKDEFETAMESVAGDFVDESSGYNYDTSKVEEDYILNYSQTLFEQHSSLIYENGDICDEDSGYDFYYEYQDCRDHVIKGLQHLLNNQYNDAYSSLLTADCDIFEVNSFTGDMWCVQFGFEDGVCDILWDMGYRP